MIIFHSCHRLRPDDIAQLGSRRLLCLESSKIIKEPQNKLLQVMREGYIIFSHDVLISRSIVVYSNSIEQNLKNLAFHENELPVGSDIMIKPFSCWKLVIICWTLNLNLNRLCAEVQKSGLYDK